jgi:UDP-N-acetyl-D-glucosamine/UDP-N-acetyl-D-galactosamine dehydrogenase
MSHNRKISVIGLGYVGLPMAVEFALNQEVVAFDISTRRIKELKQGVDRTLEADAAELKKAKLFFTSNPEDLKKADFHIIAVPTPINKAKQPDLECVLSASEIVGKQLKIGDIVVYESTVYPGATEEDCVPVLEKFSGLKCGKDFFVGYSPERINPGDKVHTFKTICKVVSGQNEKTLNIVADVYSSVVTAGVHRASSIKVAEAAKVIENTQRDINIALINELATIFEKMGIDTADVLAAAGTKWNFLKFKPGLVGGHCIGVDPYYLTYKANVLGLNPEVILAGRRINDNMGKYVAEQTIKQLIKLGKPVN